MSRSLIKVIRETAQYGLPPGESKHKGVRHLDIRESDEIDEQQLASWIKQSAAIPGWDPSNAK